MDSVKSRNTETCSIPKWQLLKATLTNLHMEEFEEQSSEDSNAIILDVRTIKEFKIGHMKNAQSFDYLSTTLAEDIDHLDMSKSYYIYCKTGRRSLRICILLRNSGFKSLYNLDTGIGDLTYQ